MASGGPPGDSKSLEHPTLKVINSSDFILSSLTLCLPLSQVPYENLNKRFRLCQKSLDRETTHVTNATQDLDKLLSEDVRDIIAKGPAVLENLIERVRGNLVRNLNKR